MNPAPAEPRPWPHSRWWLLIALVFMAHLGLIFALSDRKPIFPRQPANVPRLRLETKLNEVLALSDPTLFALPHRRSFAGAVWLQVPKVEFPAFERVDPQNWVALPEEELSTTFMRFMKTNSFAAFQMEAKPAPELTVPELTLEPEVATRSTLRIEGDLAQRRPFNATELPSRSSSDLITNSVVQALVNAAGEVVSVILLRPGGGSMEAGQRDADQFALDLAKTLRFEPVPRDGAGTAPSPAAGLSLGRIIFEWHTVPPPATNAPATPPK
jgi:hypothetical protein